MNSCVDLQQSQPLFPRFCNHYLARRLDSCKFGHSDQFLERDGCASGFVALATDERDFGGDECQFLKQDGFVLPMHKTGQHNTA